MTGETRLPAEEQAAVTEEPEAEVGAKAAPAAQAAAAEGPAATPAEEADSLAQEIKAAVRDVAEQVEKLPVTQRVIETAKEMAQQVERHPMAQKVIERMRSTAEEVDKSEAAAHVRRTVKETAEGIERSPLLSVAHRVLLAGIGAVALAQEEIEDFVNRLVERGQIAETDGKKMLKDVLERRRAVMQKAAGLADAPVRAVDDLEKRIETIVARMSIPSKEEIEMLSAKITALTKKVDELKKGQ